MDAKINITLDSENQELNKVIINDVDMTDCITRIKIEWSAEEPSKFSIDFIKCI